MSKTIKFALEFTPNPNTLKYATSEVLLKQGVANFAHWKEAENNSPLAFVLLNIEGVGSVMVGSNFVTITKTEGADWDKVHQEVSETLESHINGGGEVISEAYEKELNTKSEEKTKKSESGSQHDDEKKIMEVLETEIRPAVAMDGGDISFDKFENGIVYLVLQGSCSGCPSSTQTLKMGIETRLKELVPSVKEVVSV